MSKTQDIQDAAICLRQFRSSSSGCSAWDIAQAEGLGLSRCQLVLSKLERARLIEPVQEREYGYFRLVESATALDVLQAVWAPIQNVELLYQASGQSTQLLAQYTQRHWAQG